MRGGLLASAAAAILLVLAAGLAVAAFLLPGMDQAERAAGRVQVERAVDQIAAREQAIWGESGAFQPFAPEDVEADAGLMDLPWDSWPVDQYRFEARTAPEGGLRIRATPRADAVRALEAGAQFYTVQLAPDGEIAGSGWHPEP